MVYNDVLLIEISQGKYYTNLTRLFDAHKNGLVIFEEKEGLKFLKTLNNRLIYCYQNPSDELIEFSPI